MIFQFQNTVRFFLRICVVATAVGATTKDSAFRRSLQGPEGDTSVYILTAARLRDDLDVDQFRNVIRPDFTNFFREQRGVKVYRTFHVEFDTAHPATSNATIVTLVRYKSEKAQDRVNKDLASNSIATDYFSSLASVSSIVLTPDGDDRPPIRKVAKNGKVLGMALRNITSYGDDFDRDDFLQLRARFLQGISQIQGVGRSVSWTGPDYDVVFNTYKNSNVYRAILADAGAAFPPEFANDAETFLERYPGTRGLFAVEN